MKDKIFLVVASLAIVTSCLFLYTCGKETIETVAIHHTRTTSYGTFQADKHIVAEIQNVFEDNLETNRDYKWKIIHLKKTRKCKVEATAIYKYYVNLKSFDIAEQNGFIYVYVDPIMLDEPVGYTGIKISDKSEKGFYIPQENFDDDINKFLAADGEFSKKILIDAREKMPIAQDVAEKSLKKIMLSTYFPLLGITENEPQKIIIKFERRKSNKIRKLEVD